MVAQGLFVALAFSDWPGRTWKPIHCGRRGLETMLSVNLSGRKLRGAVVNAKPILSKSPGRLCDGPGLIRLANASYSSRSVPIGRRAGVLYLPTQIGSVCGSLAAGFGLLHCSASRAGRPAMLSGRRWLAILPLYMFTRASAAGSVSPAGAGARARSTLTGGLALALWLQLPSDYVVRRAQVLPSGGACSPSAKA